MTEVKTKTPSVKIPKNIKNAVPDLLSTALWFIFCFAASKAAILGNFAPFGVAAAAAAKRNHALPAALGAVTGYIFSGTPENTLRYVAAALMVLGAKLVFERFATGDIVPVLIACAATAFASFGYAAATLLSGYSSAMALAETVLSAGSAYFFRRTGNALEHGKPIMTLSEGDRACLILSGAIAAASLGGITIGRLNLGGIAAAFAVLLASRYGKESGGAVAGVAVGTAVAFADGNFGAEFAGFAFGGLLAGVFSPFGKLGCSLTFTAVRLMVCLLASDYPDYVPVYESVLASAFLMLIPEKAGGFVSSFAFRDEKPADSVTVKELVLSRMGLAADGLSDIAAATRKVSKSVERDNTTEMSTVLNLAAEHNCRTCSKSALCWQSRYSDTVKAFYEMGSAARERRKPSFPDEFAERCPQAERLYEDVTDYYKDAADKNSAERKLRNVRDVVTDQFEGAALLLRDIAAEASEIRSVDKKLSAAIRNLFESKGFPLFACVCYYSSDGCVNIEVSGAKDRLKKADTAEIAGEIADICGCDIALPEKRDTENARRLFFYEKPLMTAKFGTASINAAGEKFCGDFAEHFIDRSGCADMILSDGMGSGEHAALDSMMTAGLVARMVRAGFRFGPAIKLVNSALLLKSEDESLATVDAFSVNLYTGIANFYKAGAEVSYVLKNGAVSRVENSALPVGILGGAEYEHSSLRIGEGDAVVLITDGVTASGSDWIPSEIKALSEKDPSEIAEGIAKTAFDRRRDGHSDDITVMVMKLVSGY